ncbi:MAG TPA: hypothetical protein VJZ27_05100, partial [Aggregatilineales bacterium]|nr:hypothetical protein [Aggregatilineales bacterium]
SDPDSTPAENLDNNVFDLFSATVFAYDDFLAENYPEDERPQNFTVQLDRSIDELQSYEISVPYGDVFAFMNGMMNQAQLDTFMLSISSLLSEENLEKSDRIGF